MILLWKLAAALETVTGQRINLLSMTPAKLKDQLRRTDAIMNEIILAPPTAKRRAGRY